MLRGGLIASGEFLMSEEGEGALGFLYETRCGYVCVCYQFAFVRMMGGWKSLLGVFAVRC